MEILRTLRSQVGVTQKAVADYLGISRVAYTRYELGEREPDNTTLIKLAEYFNVSVDYLLGKESPDELIKKNILGSRIKQLLQNKGLTPKEFASMLNVTESMISLYESGKRLPSYDILELIANIFDVTTDYLLGRTELTKPATEYTKNINSLSESNRAKALEYIAMLKALEKVDREKEEENLNHKNA